MNLFHHQSTAYGWLTLVGIFASILVWSRAAKRDSRLILIYISALGGAFLGAKIVYLAAEGWLHWHDANRWLVLATGKSITGALLGGYVGVEAAKRMTHYRAATGDGFAVIVPLGIVFGRVGCIMQGCCLGRVCDASWYTMNDAAGPARWPAALVELLFNALMLGVVLLMRWRKAWPGQHFHLYLMAYGIFRFAHEFLRDTPRVLGPITGYQIAALAVAALGAAGFWLRRQSNSGPESPVAGACQSQLS